MIWDRKKRTRALLTTKGIKPCRPHRGGGKVSPYKVSARRGGDEGGIGWLIQGETGPKLRRRGGGGEGKRTQRGGKEPGPC